MRDNEKNAMNKLVLCAATLFAATSLAFTACSKSPYEKALSLLKDATEKVKKAKTLEELKEIEENYEAEEYKMKKTYKGVLLTKQEEEALSEADDIFWDLLAKAEEKLR